MHPSQKYLDPNQLAKLQGLQLRAHRIVDGFLAGRHRSSGRGLSLEFCEHREYAPGDDWRHVDWKVFGRTDKYYLKQFEDEANLSCYFLLDCSESMSYRGPEVVMSKLEYAKCLIASMAWLVQTRQDAIGLATLSNEVLEYMPAAAGLTALSELIHRLELADARDKTEFSHSLQHIAERTNRRSIVILVSDCMVDLADINLGLQSLTFKQHEVAVFHVLDPAELDFPFNSNVVFTGMEGAVDITTDANRISSSYRKRISGFCHQLKSDCGRHSIRYHRIRTDSRFDVALSQFLSPGSLAK